MIFLLDGENKQQFLVDTGETFSVLPHRSLSTLSGPSITGADRRDIPCWGQFCHYLTFGLRTFLVTFLLAAVSRPILGLDFLSAHVLLVDPVSRHVLDSKSLNPFSKPPTTGKR
jgi:hypothetical protein